MIGSPEAASEKRVPGELLALAERLADTSGAIIRRYFRSGVAVIDKADTSPVTIADREAEAEIRRLILAAHPDHGIIGEEHGIEHAAVTVHEGEAGAEAESAPAGEPEQPLPVLLAAADPAAGQAVAKRCASCHTFDNGGANKVGPNLWGIVGNHQAHLEGFAYSDAIKNLGGTWTYEDLDRYLASPKDYAPGTKMTFAGIKKATDRANLLAYLRTLSDAPVPFPEPSAAAAPAPAATTGEAAPPAAATTTAEAAPAGETQTAAAPAAESGSGIAGLLASADVANGEKIAKRCTACHTFDNGGANKVGPNLWDIVGDHQGEGRNGYPFSPALSGLGGTWDYAALDAYLTSPKDYAPGTKMTFAGLKKPEDRANLIAWLRTLSDSPQPLP
jgi:cytochrome c